jgi:hypothetical protein
VDKDDRFYELFFKFIDKNKAIQSSHFVSVFLIGLLKPFIHQCFINLIFILKFSTAVIE